MTLDDSEQVGRTLQYLYRIKQEHKFIAGRLDATLAAQNATQETLKELMARLAQVERQSSQVADETNQCRQACATANAGVNRGLEEVKANIERQCLKTKVLETNDHEKDCRLKTFLGLIQDVSQRLGQQEQSTSLLTTGMNRGLEEAKAHIERQCLKTKVLETNDHEKDGRLKTFLSMIQDVSQRLGQQEQSTALLLKSKGKLTKKHDDHDWESQVVNLKTENQGMRGELEAVKMQSGQLATDFKKLQEEMRELKRERSENLATQVQDASTIATVLVPRSQPEETQEPEMTQEKQQRCATFHAGDDWQDQTNLLKAPNQPRLANVLAQFLVLMPPCRSLNLLRPLDPPNLLVIVQKPRRMFPSGHFSYLDLASIQQSRKTHSLGPHLLLIPPRSSLNIPDLLGPLNPINLCVLVQRPRQRISRGPPSCLDLAVLTKQSKRMLFLSHLRSLNPLNRKAMFTFGGLLATTRNVRV
ncbi:hypothetical protein HDK90DRAFT_542095 [Phyllosticta capitalensis]|uniref:Uncharacterized protein n=1 Tax=Phyllosticta capitalensis TaxID=121624 RepID=A0ABR1YDG1_9PEZI